MASVASRPRALPRLGSLPNNFVLPVLVLLGLFVVSAYLRTNSLGESLWMDEGLSIGIASQPLLDIPSILRMDGSPPLYYMLLSVWMDVAGDGPAATQALSVAVSLVAIPGGLWAGWSLFGRRAGLFCAAMCAVNPFLTSYAQETRMYALMLVMSLLATAAFLHVFAFGRRRYLPLFMILLAGMLYTHNWGLFLGAGLALGLIPCWYVSENRSSFWKDALIGFGGAGLLYLPWVPTLLHQVQHTGAPWLNPPNFGAPVQISKSLLGGGTPTVALILAGGSGLAAILARRVEDKERTALLAGAVIVLGTLCVAWIVSQVSPGVDHALPRSAARPDAAARRPRPGTGGDARPRGARDHHRDLGDPQELRAREQVERLGPSRRRGARAAQGRPRAVDAARAGAAARVPPREPRRGARPSLRQPHGGGRRTTRSWTGPTGTTS